KILDFGLGRLSQPAAASPTKHLTQLAGKSVMQGTPDYMAPEQAVDFHSADIRADIYSLGCTLYYLLTGQPPFAGATLAENLMKHQTVPPRPIAGIRNDVPVPVGQVLDQMLAKQPRDRCQTPGEVAEALMRNMPETPRERPARLRRWFAAPAGRLPALSWPR